MLAFRSIIQRAAAPAPAVLRCRTRSRCRSFADAVAAAAGAAGPVRGVGLSMKERAALRAARKERASKVIEQQKGGGGGGGGVTAATVGGKATSSTNIAMSRYIWYLSVGLPSALLVWGLNDENSPPAKFSALIGLTGFVKKYTDEIAKPAHKKLLPDWSELPNVPHDIPVPHTLVLDLEQTLVSSTWDRKHGWRHAKRPGVDKFLHEMAQYYEIVLYTPSIEGIAEPLVAALDKDGCFMHRLYRDATYYCNGVHVKDLNSLNRNVKRMIVLDDDPEEVQFNQENMIRVKPYTDPNNRTDNTLERITPFLIEIAREGYSDIPELLSQYRGMDADGIADEQDRRLEQLRYDRQQQAQRGLGGWARSSAGLPAPELPPTTDGTYSSSAPQQLTAKDIAGEAPTTGLESSESGLVGWMNRRAKEKQEHQMRKMEKWQEVMMKKQKEKETAAKKAAS